MTKKILFIIFIIFVTNIFFLTNAEEYKHFIPKNSLVKVYTKIPLSTQNLEEGSEVYFIAPSDVWVVEKKAIKKGDIFLGYVSKLKMPTQGVNAAISIDITDIIDKNTKEKIPIKAKLVFSNGEETFGGDLTNPASYNTTIHPRRVYGNRWGGTLQHVPSGEYEFGQHVKITQRDSIFVRFDEDYYIY